MKGLRRLPNPSRWLVFLGGQSMAILCTHSNKKKNKQRKGQTWKKTNEKNKEERPSEANQDYDSKRD